MHCKMRYLVIYLNVLVGCLFWEAYSINMRCKTVAGYCLKIRNVDKKIFGSGLLIIQRSYVNLSFHFETVANKDMLKSFCRSFDAWSRCFSYYGCAHESDSVRKQLYPANILCEEGKDFLDSPSCWKGTTVAKAMGTCTADYDRQTWDCETVKKAVRCMKYRFDDLDGCSKKSKSFIHDLLDEYLEYDVDGVCKT